MRLRGHKGWAQFPSQKTSPRVHASDTTKVLKRPRANPMGPGHVHVIAPKDGYKARFRSLSASFLRPPNP
jgi:hypothetical protein